MRDLSIIIPAYNEAPRIGKSLFAIANFLDERDLDDEVIVANDGSFDNTAAVAKGYAHLFKHFRIVSSDRNIGRGHAVRTGLLTANGRHRLVLDVDSPVDISEFNTLMTAANAEPVPPAVISGTRGDVPSDDGGANQRSGLGRIASRLVEVAAVGVEPRFRIFAGETTDAILNRCTSNGWAFDIEALSCASGLGYHVLEVPIFSQRRDEMAIRSLSAGFEVARFRIRNELGLQDFERV